MTFSERYGFKPEKAIQIDDIDNDLRTELWNCLHPYFQRISHKIVPGSTFFNGRTFLEVLADWLWVNVLRKPGDELAKKYKDQVKQLKDYFVSCTWYEAYDFVESVAQACSKFDAEGLPEFVDACNIVLKRERSAYRFVDMLIVPVTSEHEIAGIEGALAATSATASLNLVNTHLKQALALLSDRTA
ncbi:MAG TPA: hypothetical protein VFV38_11700, partial [Ktedonobacteraceae bacterium]|nr:hypothetical protein [Ktedonobacteraceae bacterium]